MTWLWRIWSLLYFILLGYVVFFAGRRPAFHWNPKESQFRFTPFTMKWYLYTHANNISSVYVDIMGNIVMFVPYTLFLYIVFGVRNYWLMMSSAFLLSVGIETIQYFTGVGYADIDDVIFNTFGALLGVLVIDGVKRCRPVLTT